MCLFVRIFQLPKKWIKIRYSWLKRSLSAGIFHPMLPIYPWDPSSSPMAVRRTTQGKECLSPPCRTDRLLRRDRIISSRDSLVFRLVYRVIIVLKDTPFVGATFSLKSTKSLLTSRMVILYRGLCNSFRSKFGQFLHFHIKAFEFQSKFRCTIL